MHLTSPPGPGLAPLVHSLTAGQHGVSPPRHLWPDPHVELVFSTAPLEFGTFAGRTWRAGAVSTPGLQWRPLTCHVGVGNTLRVRLYPWTPPALYAEMLAGSAGGAAPEVVDRLRASDLQGAVEAAEFWLHRRADSFPGPGPLQRAVRHLYGAPLAFHLPELEDLAGCSARELQRRSREELGMTLKGFQRLARFRAAVAALARPPVPPLAELALNLGYADQAHFAREVRAFAGLSPTRLARHLGA
ncbi:AraC family transcriptional regulator [Deinococcus apachensis]|uniref:AraC family transcriptional regulator n=1 Tax=Deinococcus apachensis TaxID=309886 RepID=UPI000370ED59|nr:helix-turn-helix domain-containing protein [Deinococcus apachensis]